ncbi:MAG: right-handed parallel beta-helix repeat-containing protein [Bacteroidales bacterium]
MLKRILVSTGFWIAFLLFHDSVFAQDTVRMGDFGLLPGTHENAVLYVRKALENCKTKKNPVLVFEKGRYDFYPESAIEKQYYESNTDVIPFRTCAILVEKMMDLTIDCRGADFVFHGRIQPFTVDNSQNIKIKNVSIDWDIPLTAQAQVLEVSDSYVDISIDTVEFPYTIEKQKLVFVGEGWKSQWGGVMEFDKNTKLIPQGTGDYPCLGNGYSNYKAQQIKPGRVRLNYNFKRKPAVGNFLVLRHSARDHAGTFIFESKNVVIENMNMYHNCGLGILSQYSENLTFRKVNCVPNPIKNRILSGHDDGFHYSNCKGQITVDSCRFMALMDDPINVHGTSVQVIEIKNSKELVCKFMHNQSIGFNWARAGDKVGFIENDAMNTLGAATVESFQALTPEVFEIRFNEAIPQGFSKGDALENLTWTPDVLIKNSFFGSNRARGILMTTPGKVLIENNTFESSGSAILIAGDANGWFESGAVTDVTIRNNIFNDPCMTSMYQFCDGIISIWPEIPKPENNKLFHRNIKIENNEFRPFDYPVLYAKSVDGLTFKNNRLIKSNRFKPFHSRKYTITLDYCNNVEISGNKLTDDILGKNIKLFSTSEKTLKLTSENNFKIVK